jgi:hypothetical protein
VTLDWDDVVDVLTKCACYDNRRVGNANVEAWSEALSIGNVTSKTDALRAVAIHHVRNPGTWCQPGHVAAIVREIRDDRISRAGEEAITELTIRLGSRYAAVRAIGDGQGPPGAIEGPGDPSAATDAPTAPPRRPRRPAPTPEGGGRPVKASPQPAVTQQAAEQQEAERARQLAELDALTRRNHS